MYVKIELRCFNASQFDLYIHKYVCLVGAFICNKGLLQFLYHCVQCLHRVMLTSSGGKCGQSRALDNQLGPREHKVAAFATTRTRKQRGGLSRGTAPGGRRSA